MNVVDVLMLYTTQARVGAGGTAAILTNINLAMVEANSVMQNSRANVRLRLVHTAEIAYTESGSVTTDLSRLRNPADPSLGQWASILRDQYAADLVCLVTETGTDYQFYGLQGPSAENAFSILGRPYLTGLNYLPVTLSFNFGCQLDPMHADSPGAFPYAYGYTLLGTNQGILFGQSYNCTVESFMFPSQRLPFFSNPDIVYQGIPAGIPPGQYGEADNTLVLNHTAPIVATFRGTAPTTLPPTVQFLSPSGGTNSPLLLTQGANLILLTSASDADGFVQSVSFYYQDITNGVAHLLGSATNAPYGLNCADIPAGNWMVFAVATDNVGASTRTDSGIVLQVAPVPPPNDNFAKATVLTGTNALFVATTTIATYENGENDWGDGDGSVWYSWTAPISGRALVSGQLSLPYFGVFTGTSVSNLTMVTDNQGYIPSIDFPVVVGNKYRILVVGPTNVGSSFNMILAVLPPPANDNFANRAPWNGTNISANNFAATLQSGEPDPVGWGGFDHSLWWTWKAPSDGAVIINANGGFTYAIGIYQGTVLTNLIEVSGGFDGPTLASVVGGQSYQIQVAGEFEQSGDMTLNAAFYPRPVQDHFAGRASISGNWITVTNSNLGAQVEANSPVQNSESTLWWSWTAPVSGYVTISSSPDSTIDVFTGSALMNLVSVTTGAPASFAAVAGTTYAIAASSSDNGDVPLSLQLSTVQIATPTNGSVFNEGDTVPLTAIFTDNDGQLSQIQYFANGTLLGIATNAPFTLEWSNVPSGNFVLTAVATNDAGHALNTPPVSISINSKPLVELVSPTNGTILFANIDSLTYNAATSITLTASIKTNADGFQKFYFSGNAGLGNPVFLDITDAPATNVTWNKPPFGNFNLSVVAIDTFGFSHSSVPVSISILHPAPSNDDFTNAIMLAGLANSTSGTTVGATLEPDESTPYGSSYASVWYAWTAPATATAHITLTPDPYTYTSASCGVYTGPNLTNLSLAAEGRTVGGGPFVGASSASLSFPAVAGTTYYIDILDAYNFSLQISQDIPQANFNSPTLLTGLPVFANGVFSNSTPWTSIWYSWTAPTNGLVETREIPSITPPGTSYYLPSLNVYTGTKITNLVLQAAPRSGINYFQAVAGTTYMILLSGPNESFTFGLVPAWPANDNFAARQPVTGIKTNVLGTTWQATVEPGEPAIPSTIIGLGGLSAGAANVTVWYSWVAPADGLVELSCPSCSLGVFTGTSVSNLTAVVPPGLNYLTFPAIEGTEYEIVVGNASFSTVGAIIPAPHFNLSLVMPKAQFVTPTNGSVFPAPGNFQIIARTIDVEGAVVSVALYNGSNFMAIATNAPFQFDCTNVPPGDNSLCLVATDEKGSMTTNMPVDVRVQPWNDNFTNRFVISGAATNFIADNSGATTEQGEYLPGGASGRTLWWTWQAPTNGTITITATGFSTSGSGIGLGTPSFAEPAETAEPLDIIVIGPPPLYPPGPTAGPLIAVYTNSALTNLSLCASNSVWFNSFASFSPSIWYLLPSVNIPVIAGQHYEISLDGVNGSFGPANVNFTFAPAPTPPPNDNFFQATVLQGSQVQTSGTTISATLESGEPLATTNMNLRSIWYSWTAPASGSVTVTEYDFGNPISSFRIGIYTGSQFTNLTLVASSQGTTTFFAQAGTTYHITVASLDGAERNFNFYLNGPPPPPFAQTQTSGMHSDGHFHLGIIGAIGQSFVIQASTNLVNWETIDVDTLAGTSLDFMETGGTAYKQRFYRVLPLSAFFDSQQPVASLAPANDDFTNRQVLNLSSNFVEISGNNEYATSEPDEWFPTRASGKTLWWSWTAPANGTVTLSATTNECENLFANNGTNGPEFVNGPLFYIFTGDALTNLSLVASNFTRSTTHGYYGTASGPLLVKTNATFAVLAGVTYSMAVDGCNGTAGAFDISFLAALHPPFFNGEVTLTNGAYSLTFANTNLFGTYDYKNFPNLYHYDLGNIYFEDAQDASRAAYLYDYKSGHWWYTSPELFPYIYDFSLDAWLYYYPDPKRPGHYTTNPRSFYNFATQQVTTM